MMTVGERRGDISSLAEVRLGSSFSALCLALFSVGLDFLKWGESTEGRVLPSGPMNLLNLRGFSLPVTLGFV